MMMHYGQIVRLASTSPVNYAFFHLLSHSYIENGETTSRHITLFEISSYNSHKV